jgi:hypothetical protein
MKLTLLFSTILIAYLVDASPTGMVDLEVRLKCVPAFLETHNYENF